mgnify:FL=1
MGNSQRVRGWMVATAMVTAAALAVLSPSEGTTVGQTAAYRAPRLPGTAHPDLSGIWQAFVTANWDVQDHGVQAGPFVERLGVWGAQPAGQGVVEGNEIPYRPEALAKKRENFENRLAVDHDNVNTVGDPEAKCYLPGVPRATYLPFPFQIIQSTEKIIIAYQFASANRTIPLGQPTTAPVDSWMGWSNGHWEGDTLVVDVTGFHDLSWFDRAGNYHSDALHVVERYTPMSPYHLQYEATIEDPKVFTRPWKISMPLYRRLDSNMQILDYECSAFDEAFRTGPASGP